MAWQSFGIHYRGTKRFLGLLYLILVLLLNDEVHSAFEVREFRNPFSWETSILNCNSSNINLTIAVPIVDFCSMTVLDKLDFKGDAWVGYFQTYEYFIFIGKMTLLLERTIFYKLKSYLVEYVYLFHA
ncbi:hypothetical protein ACJMK2_022792 [Sinanodonta woodiana]|uniref:Uncharacterized protein n=1 Tax=Sinanodonta woodiana TaxID=1069815 RepID=A0ABD3TMA1_SINWO